MQENTRKLKEKWNAAPPTVEGPVAGKTNRRIGKCISTDTFVVYQVCACCNEEKELTPDNFCLSNSNKNKFLTCEMGQESFRNSLLHPCRNCHANIKAIKHSKGIGYAKSLVSTYPKLNITWYEERKRAQHDCYFTFDLLSIVEDTADPHKVGIHNEASNNEHLPESCVLDPASMNISEYEMLKIANVKTLSQLWIQHIMPTMLFNLDAFEPVVQEFMQRMKNTVKENGVTASWKDSCEYNRQRKMFHVPYMILNKIQHCNEADKKQSYHVAESDKLSREYFVSLFLSQQGRCFYSNIAFSFNRDDWRHWSIERIDNEKGHAKGNVVLICRAFNAQGARRSSIWKWIQCQTHVAMSEKQKEQCRAQEEMDVEELFATLKKKLIE